MKISRECYLCIYTQTLNLTKRLGLDEDKAGEILRGVGGILSKYDLNITPPEIAAEVYEFISKVTGIEDPFSKEKKTAIKEALKFKDILEKRLEKSKERLYDACKIAVAGNVIDLGVNQEYDLQKEIKNIFELEFRHNDYDEFKNRLRDAESIVYLGDNAGENVFDEILIKELKKYAGKIYYFTRGKPIINDITLKDLNGLEIFEIADVYRQRGSHSGISSEICKRKSKRAVF